LIGTADKQKAELIGFIFRYGVYEIAVGAEAEMRFKSRLDAGRSSSRIEPDARGEVESRRDVFARKEN
jgi:hypothetical protein